MNELEHESAIKNSRPLKQIMASIKDAKHPLVGLYVKEYYERIEKSDRRRKDSKNEIARERRAAKRAAPAQRIEAEGQQRLRLLRLAVRGRRGDKLLEQLVCREEELTEFWVAMRLAALKARPGAPTDAEVGALFESRTGFPCNKNKARTRRKLVAALEKHPWVWLKLPPGSQDANSSPRDPV